MTDADIAAVIEEKNRVVRENWELRAALAPFAAVEKGIPDNWPGFVALSWEEGADVKGFRRAWANYLHGDTDTIAPRIDAYRRAAELLSAPE